MNATIELNGQIFMRDAKGRLTPVELVRPSDKLEDQLVRSVLGHADNLNQQIARFKGYCFDDIGAHLDLIAEKYGFKPKDGAKGNMTFTTYDGLMKVQVAIADTLVFGPELQVAKGLIDECIAEWSIDSRVEIRALVEHAFRTDREGQVSREAVFSLRKIDIDDPRWRNAIQAINDSIRIQGSKTYLRFYRRAKATDRFENVTIDLASAELPAAAPHVAA
jgi:Protein of unknown function (DUF3164)